MLIYIVTRKSDGKSYIGQTCGTLKARLAEHIRHDRTGIGAAIRRQGRGKFIAEEIAQVNCKEEADRIERRYINLLHTLEPSGYNLKPGGNGQRAHGRPLRPKSRKRERKAKEDCYIEVEPEAELIEKARQDYFDSFSLS